MHGASKLPQQTCPSEVVPQVSPEQHMLELVHDLVAMKQAGGPESGRVVGASVRAPVSCDASRAASGCPSPAASTGASAEASGDVSQAGSMLVTGPITSGT